MTPWIRHPGWKNPDRGSGKNISDPQHCFSKTLTHSCSGSTLRFTQFFYLIEASVTSLREKKTGKKLARTGVPGSMFLRASFSSSI
jgi:hypothetical protein